MKARIQKASYTIQYDRFVDNETWEFIVSHSQRDAFLRQRESLNWMLGDPFVHEAPLMNRVGKEILFSSSKEWQRYYVVKVFVRNEMAGVYILCDSSTRLSLLQLYYNIRWQEEVLLSIAEHILKFENIRFSTTNSVVADFVKTNQLYPLNYVSPTSICYPSGFESVSNREIQGGDGDMFLN